MTETRLDSLAQRAYLLPMIKTAEINQFAGLAELVKQVQAGDEIVLTNGHKPVAKIISAIGIMEEWNPLVGRLQRVHQKRRRGFAPGNS